MATTVHIPKELLAKVDARAKNLGISRNKLVVQALEKELGDDRWPPGFFETLTSIGEEVGEDFRREFVEGIVKSRRSRRKPVTFDPPTRRR